MLRMLLDALQRSEIDTGGELDDAAVHQILQKQVKQRQESIRQFSEAGREDLAEKERAEIVVLEDYLPTQLNEAEIEALVSQTIQETGASEMKDMGKLMSALRSKAAGKADMAVVSRLAKASLSSS